MRRPADHRPADRHLDRRPLPAAPRSAGSDGVHHVGVGTPDRRGDDAAGEGTRDGRDPPDDVRWRHGSDRGAAAARRTAAQELRTPVLLRRRIRDTAAALAVPSGLPHDGLRNTAGAVLAGRTDQRACRSHSCRCRLRSATDQDSLLRQGRQESLLRTRRLYPAVDEARAAKRLRDGRSGHSPRGIGDDLAER